MLHEAGHPGKRRFFALSSDDLDQLVVSWGWPKFRAQQVRHWVYGKFVADPAQMTNLSAQQRQTLAEQVEFAPAALTRNQLSADGTRKLLLTWSDGRQAETVMIPDADRRTACISSQVGCPVGCKFCASGIGGLKGNLDADQIVEQIFHLNVALKADGDPVGRITNVVLMGMGEPLANYANVMTAIRRLNDADGFQIGARRITLSTVGLPPKMRELAREDLAINLAISLHAPDEALRRQLIPWAEHFALEDILAAATEYFEKTGREITLEYILLAGVNDRPEHARRLAQLCKRLRANVNLIRYNEVVEMGFKRPASDDVVRFQEILRQAGVNVHVRKSRGRDIDAACGQLRRNEQLVQLGGAPPSGIENATADERTPENEV